jgi:hypothetical protein
VDSRLRLWGKSSTGGYISVLMRGIRVALRSSGLQLHSPLLDSCLLPDLEVEGFLELRILAIIVVGIYLGRPLFKNRLALVPA